MQDLKPYLQDDFSTQKGQRTDTEFVIGVIQGRNAGD